MRICGRNKTNGRPRGVVSEDVKVLGQFTEARHGDQFQSARSHGAQAADHRAGCRRRRRQCRQQHDHAKLEGVSFVVANTDAQALPQSKANRKIQLGAKLTEGLGAGAQPDVGRAAAEESIDEILEHLSGLAHGVHHRRHGRRHRHRRGAGHRARGARARHPDRRRRDQAVPLRRRQAHAVRRARHRGAAEVRRYADRHPEPEPVPRRQRAHHLRPGLRHGRRSAAFRRARRHRPDRHAGPDQPRLRRHQDGDLRDGQGDDGHRRGRRRGPRAAAPPKRRSPTRCSTMCR